MSAKAEIDAIRKMLEVEDKDKDKKGTKPADSDNTEEKNEGKEEKDETEKAPAPQSSGFGAMIAGFGIESEEERSERLRLEEKLKTYLPKAAFEEWKKRKKSSWGEKISKIPFGEYIKPSDDIKAVEKVFDDMIIGRDREKQEMLRKYASFCISGKMRRPILLVGEPGCGKSCFSQSFSKATGFPIKYINVPTIGTPIALMGSEQHYSNTQIGDMMKTIIDEQTLSVVFVFDEIDKAVTSSNEGSVEAALLGLFDPMWNGMFTDRSLNVPVDMSHCVFICTANSLADISEPLIDRMDVIRFDQYEREEYINIIEQKTMPDCVKVYDMQERISFAPDMAEVIIDSLEGKTSMRDYEKIIEKLIDNANFNILNSGCWKYKITADDLNVILYSEKAKVIGFGK